MRTGATPTHHGLEHPNQDHSKGRNDPTTTEYGSHPALGAGQFAGENADADDDDEDHTRRNRTNYGITNHDHGIWDDSRRSMITQPTSWHRGICYYGKLASDNDCDYDDHPDDDGRRQLTTNRTITHFTATTHQTKERDHNLTEPSTRYTQHQWNKSDPGHDHINHNCTLYSSCHNDHNTFFSR